MSPDLCRCGHGLHAHTGTGVAGLPCSLCAALRQPDRCNGWEPTTPASPTLCVCGHPETDHPDSRPSRICTTCQRQGSDGCWGWWPSGSKAIEVELVEADTAGPPDIQGGDAHATQPSGLASRLRVTGPAADLQAPHTPRPTDDSRAREVREVHESAAGPPDLHQAIQAATEALDSYEAAFAWGHPEILARVAVEAAWGVLTQPLADLQRDLDYANRELDPWTAEQARELDRLATFETAVRQALKPWTWSGIDADGKSYRDVVEEVAMAVVALDQARERTDG